MRAGEPSTVSMMICLATPRLLLRSPRREDLTVLATLVNQAEVDLGQIGSDANGRDSNSSDSNHRASNGRGEQPELGWFVLERLDDATVVGLVGLHPPDDGDGPETAQIRWYLDPKAQHQGYATEAGSALIDWGFGFAGLDTIVAVIAVDHIAARQVATRIGMRHRQRTMATESGNWVDRYAIDADDWSGGRP